MSATSNDRIHLEANFEEYITRKLAMLEGDGWRVSNNDAGFDPNTALYMPDFIEYLSMTAPDKLEKMKLMSHREYKHDLSDIVGILHDEQAHGNRITADKVFSAVDYLYGDSCKLRDDLAEDVRAWCGMDRHALEEEYRRMNDVEYATRTEVIRISAENESMHRKKTIDEIIKEAEQKAKQSTKDKTTIPPKPSLDELIKEAEKKAAKKAGKTSWDNDIGSRER